MSIIEVGGISYVTYHDADEMPPLAIDRWAEVCSGREPHLKIRTPEELRATLLVAITAWRGDDPIGFGGIFRPPIWSEPMLAVAGGDWVDVSVRRQHIWENVCRLRIDLARRRGWGLVSISGNPDVIDGLTSLGARAVGWEWLRRILQVKPRQTLMALPEIAKEW